MPFTELLSSFHYLQGLQQFALGMLGFATFGDFYEVLIDSFPVCFITAFEGMPNVLAFAPAVM